MNHSQALFKHANYQTKHEKEKSKLFNTLSPMVYL